MTKQEVAQEILDPATDKKVAAYVEILMRRADDLLSAVKTGGATIVVSLEEFIEELQAKLYEERDEYRVTRYSRPPPDRPTVAGEATATPTLPSPPRMPADLTRSKPAPKKTKRGKVRTQGRKSRR